jgi:hypothetical protein
MMHFIHKWKKVAFLNAQQDKFVELLRVERDEATQQVRNTFSVRL